MYDHSNENYRLVLSCGTATSFPGPLFFTSGKWGDPGNEVESTAYYTVRDASNFSLFLGTKSCDVSSI